MTWIAVIVSLFGVGGILALVLVAVRSWQNDRDQLARLKAKIEADEKTSKEINHERKQLEGALKVVRSARDALRQAHADMVRDHPELAPGYLNDSLRYISSAEANRDQADRVPEPKPANPTGDAGDSGGD